MATPGEVVLLSNSSAKCTVDHNKGTGGSRHGGAGWAGMQSRRRRPGGRAKLACPVHKTGKGGRRTEQKKVFAHSHIPLEEFLDIKAGVMTVKVVSFYSRKGCHAHTPSEQVCTTDSLCERLSLHAGAVRRLFILWYSRFSVRMKVPRSMGCH